MRVYTPLSLEHKNALSERARQRAIEKYPIGLKLRRLEVVGHVRMVCSAAKAGRSYWAVRCRCACGNETVVRPNSLTGNGKSESCGCVGIRKRSEASKRVWMLPPGEAAKRAVFGRFKAQAEHRGIPVELTLSQFTHISAQKCRYCDSDPDKVYGSSAKGKPRLNGTFVYNGIDRVDSTGGYIYGNCVPCCSQCNYAKHDMDVESFKQWLRRAASHFIGMA